jgi:hypothetical protein
MRGTVICAICVVLQAGGRHKWLSQGHRTGCAMVIVGSGCPASSISCASSASGGSPGFGFFGMFTFRYTSVLRPRRCPALGDLTPLACAGSEGRGRRATDGGRGPVGRSLRRRRAAGGLRTRNLRADGASRRSPVGGTDREAPFGRDPARLVPASRAQRAGSGQGTSPPGQAG